LNQSATRLKVGGFTRLSTCDWPGELAATVFCQGCAWDCPYCHNPGLRPVTAAGPISWSSVLDFLGSRRNLLDAVIFSGGEPTLQPALLDAIGEVRALGFRVGLHTTGMVPDRFAALLPSLDWVGFDVKAPFAAYPCITGVERSGDKALKSLRSLLASHVPYEVRTTVHPSLLSPTDMLELEAQLIELGVENFVVQQFRMQGVLSGRLPAAVAGLVLPHDYGSGFARFETR
jgi:pyruvate formate lyase activating enzyme